MILRDLQRLGIISMPVLTLEEFAEKYHQPKDGNGALHASKLGQGGASSGVEK